MSHEDALREQLRVQADEAEKKDIEERTRAKNLTRPTEEIFEKDAVALIEWGERFPRLMPDGSLEIRLEQTADDERRITCNF